MFEESTRQIRPRMAHNSHSQDAFSLAAKETSIQKIPDIFPDAVYHRLTPAPKHPNYYYNGFRPGTTLIKQGHVRAPGLRAFSTDVVFQRDMAITVRDGIKLYTDLFRPVDSDENPVPVIIPWSPYGKTGTGPQNYDTMAPFRAGYPKDKWSGYHKFEVCSPENAWPTLINAARDLIRPSGVQGDTQF